MSVLFCPQGDNQANMSINQQRCQHELSKDNSFTNILYYYSQFFSVSDYTISI